MDTSSKMYLGRKLACLPGAMESYLWLSDVLGFRPAYDTSWRHLEDWLAEAEQLRSHDDEFAGQRILFFAVVPHWVDFMLALASILVGHGNEIDFAWRVKYDNEANECAYWRRSGRRVQATLRSPHFRLVDLDAVQPQQSSELVEEIVRTQSLIDVSYFRRKLRIDVEQDPEDKAMFDVRHSLNLDATLRVASLLAENAYERVILPNGVTREFGAVARYVTECGVPFSSVETSDVSGRMFVSNDAAMRIDTNDLWNRDAPHVLSRARRSRIRRQIEEREQPRTEMLTINYQNTEVVAPESIRGHLGLTGDRNVVLMCPNVPFDSMFYVAKDRLFEDMWDWLIRTLRFFCDREDSYLILRSHPAEPYWNATETTKSIIERSFSSLPGHIIVIPPEADINTYSIMRIADVGVVYASTTGLEMAMRGIPVVCGLTNQHYNQRGFTVDSHSSRSEYFVAIDRILGEPSRHRLTERQVELSWCYADVYFNQLLKEFPWGVKQNLWQGLEEWPISRMVSSEGSTRYGGVFAALLGDSGGS